MSRLAGTQNYRLSHNWQPLMDSNHRMSESKSDALTGLGEGAIYLAPIFFILTQANVHSLRLVATQLGSHGQFRNVDLSLIKRLLFL